MSHSILPGLFVNRFLDGYKNFGPEINTASLKALTETDKAVLNLLCYIQLLFDNKREDDNNQRSKKLQVGKKK